MGTRENTGVLTQSTEDAPIDVRDAYLYCERVARGHYENFPVASLLLPKEKRAHIYSIYAFARGADDFADEGGMPADERIARIGEWQSMLDAAYSGNPTHPVFIALRNTVRQLDIPKVYFTSLLKAFRQDVVQRRYETLDDLIEYCKNSANPVGRLVLHVFGYRDENLYRYSDYLCTALQLANFWQDLEIDLSRNRIYLPLEDMDRFDYYEGELMAKRATPEFKRLMQLQIERTRALFRAGYQITRLVRKDLRVELRLTWFGGMKILDKIEKLDYDVFGRRPKIRFWDIPGLMLRAASKRDPANKRRSVYVS